MVIQIHFKRKADLFEVGKTNRLLTFLFGARERGQQQRGKNGDDCNYNQQFN